ncbi:MAG: glycosyltransferase [Bacteroidota bacterium]
MDGDGYTWIQIAISVVFALRIGLYALLVMGVSRINPTKANTSPPPPLSIIIAARNEAANLQEYLPSILQQAYSEKFEVLVALNGCTDNSEAVLHSLQRTYGNLRYSVNVDIPTHWSPKKFALSEAIRQVSYEHLLFTDADCLPEANWVQSVGNHFTHGAEVILGVGYYQKCSGLLNLFIQFETFYTALQYTGAAAWGNAYMGVGRNLAYTRSLFEKNQGFNQIADSLSGDDDLFVNSVAKTAKVTVMLDTESATLSTPELTWKNWGNQKIRHLSASNLYNWQSKAWLGIFHISHSCCWVATILFLCQFSFMSGLGGWIFGRILAEWLMSGLAGKLRREKKVLFAYPVLDFMFFLYNLLMVPLSRFVRPQWKTRS